MFTISVRSSVGFCDDDVTQTANTKPHLNDRMCTVIRLAVTANCQNGMNVSSRISMLCFFPSTNGHDGGCWWWCILFGVCVWKDKPFHVVVATLSLTASASVSHPIPSYMVPDWNLMEKVLRLKCQIVKRINGTGWPHRLTLVNFSQNFTVYRSDELDFVVYTTYIYRKYTTFNKQQRFWIPPNNNNNIIIILSSLTNHKQKTVHKHLLLIRFYYWKYIL